MRILQVVEVHVERTSIARYRGFDPFEDTARRLLFVVCFACGRVTGGSIRLRILQVLEERCHPVDHLVTGGSIRLRILQDHF